MARGEESSDDRLTVTQIVADYASSSSLTAVPEPVQERARLVIIDEIASACFGARSVAGDILARYAMDAGGRQESTVLGTDLRAPAALAALVNGTGGHGEEVDGAHVVGGHPGATVVTAALAMAERQRVTGAELLNAVILGYDIGTRAVQACGGVFGVRGRFKLHSDFLFGLGAAAAGARILGLDSTRHRYALALATFQINGLDSLFQESRHLSKSFSNGQYAAAGVQAALLSALGLEGSEDVLGAPHGLLDAWGADNAPDIMTNGLGSEFAVMGANFKFVNAGYPIHAPIEAAVGLMRHNAISLDDIASVTIGMPANSLKVVDNRAMHNICVQDMVAAAITHNGLAIRQVPFPDILGDLIYQTVRGRTVALVDADLERDQPKGRGARVTIALSDGRRYSERVDAPRGHSARESVMWEDLEEKWRDGLPHHDIDRIIQLGRRLHELDDVSILTHAFQAS